MDAASLWPKEPQGSGRLRSEHSFLLRCGPRPRPGSEANRVRVPVLPQTGNGS